MGWNRQFAFNILQVKPPLVHFIGFNVSQKLISLYGKVPRHRDVAHGPLYKPMKRRVGLIPGTNADTNTTTGAKFVAHPLSGAFFHVIRPFFIAVINNLVTKRYRP